VFFFCFVFNVDRLWIQTQFELVESYARRIIVNENVGIVRGALSFIVC